MEGVEAFLEGEWESLSKLFSHEDSDLLLHCNGNLEIPFSFFDQDLLLPQNGFSSASQESSTHSCSEIDGSLFAFFAEESAAGFTHTFDDQPMHLVDDSCKEVQIKRKCEEEEDDDDDDDESLSAKKRPYREAKTNKRNARSKKAKRVTRDKQSTINSDEEMKNAICTSKEEGEEEEISESPEKAKAGKNPATDPQSLYARKRRERINGRLKVLQNLVPNGTKVDISTMLEEAVHYVKFLQLQIKLLSSDDKWMYAPIAYNGMDIGHYQKIVPNL